MAGAYMCVTIESILNLSLNLEHPQIGLGQFAKILSTKLPSLVGEKDR